MFKFGLGYRIKKLINKNDSNHKLILGCTEINSNFIIQDYFDGDIITISIVDALIGIIYGNKNIQNFIKDNNLIENDSSVKVIDVLNNILIQNNLIVDKIDCYIAVEYIKMKPYYDSMLEHLSRLLNVDSNKILINATTADKVGPVGRGEAIEAITLVVLKKNI